MASNKTSAETVTTTGKKISKINVTRYCQLKELSSGITSIMKNKYPMETHTIEEWDVLLEGVLNRKVK